MLCAGCTTQNTEFALGYRPADEARKKLHFMECVLFHATYAAVDGFNPSKNPLDVDDLNILIVGLSLR